MLGTILLVLLILMLVGALPAWGHSRNWGYAPSGSLGERVGGFQRCPPGSIAESEELQRGRGGSLVSRSVEMESVLGPEARIIESCLRPEVEHVALLVMGYGEQDLSVLSEPSGDRAQTG